MPARSKRHNIAGVEFDLRAKRELLPKLISGTATFDPKRKIRATVVKLTEAGKDKPMVCGFLCASPEIEKKQGLSAQLKGKKRLWISTHTAPAAEISRKYGKGALDEAMLKLADELKAAAKRQGVEILLACPSTPYGKQLAEKTGYKRIPGTSVWMKKVD